MSNKPATILHKVIINDISDDTGENVIGYKTHPSNKLTQAVENRAYK